ncbi:MAG TPA: fumarylacetoacetase [Anaerolineales bacterium]|nr:fumarylacetoacetase [Anaerolineales bacterium]
MKIESFIPINQDSHFPIQNLPFGVFTPRGEEGARVGVRIGDVVVDCARLDALGFFGYQAGMRGVFRRGRLNEFMGLGRPAWREARTVLTNLLRAENPTLQDPEVAAGVLVPISETTLHLPADIGDYTDFYASREHASNVGTMFRGPENALMPNWLHLPVGYHGRASSVVITGHDVVRPRGQVLPTGADRPIHIPTRSLDFELEMGFFVGPGNPLGEPVPIDRAGEHIFGMVLLNDWSARDIQGWEYQPLGPFLAKNFATSISPWVVTMDALESFRVPGPVQDPVPLAYLARTEPSGLDIRLEVQLQTAAMDAPQRISRSNLKHLYWSLEQQLAHHSATGCNLRPGDLLGTGTISGPDPGSYGSLLELTWRGEKPLELPGGEMRAFLEDGDRVTISGYCKGEGYRVGFGSVTGTVLPARSDDK